MGTEEFRLDSSKRDTCANAELVRSGRFYIEKHVYEEQGKDVLYQFKAVLQKLDNVHLSKLDTEPGKCNDVETNPGSLWCGLATKLMIVCFKDKGVTQHGGINPMTETGFLRNPVRLRQVRDMCATLVFVQVSILDESPVQAAIGYLKAGNEAGYKKLYTFNTDTTKMDLMNTEDAIEEYKGPAASGQRFLDTHGKYWYFCKCKLLSCPISK